MVWPALFPPWKRTTMSARFDSQSMILPLPSSPHWAPITVTFDMDYPVPYRSTRGEPRARWPCIAGVDCCVRGYPPHPELRGSSAAYRGATLNKYQLPSPFGAKRPEGGRCHSEVSAEPT